LSDASIRRLAENRRSWVRTCSRELEEGWRGGVLRGNVSFSICWTDTFSSSWVRTDRSKKSV
jgi:hypothetical protein